MRVENWESKLASYLENVGPFEWGKNDCCLFAANAVEIMTGVDYAKKYRGYKTKLGAAKKLKGKLLDQVLSEELGFPINSKMTKRGDVVLFKTGGEQAVGICVGAQFASISESGLVVLSMQHATMGWAI